MLKNPLLEVKFHLATDAEQQNPRAHADHPHDGGQQQHHADVLGNLPKAQAHPQAIDAIANDQGNPHPEQVDQQQSPYPQTRLSPVGLEIVTQLLQVRSRHSVPFRTAFPS
jgi:hypothetical protein